MKKSLILLTFFLLFLLALKSGDLIELSSALNARSSANFYRSSNNIEAVLEKGTTGVVLETVKLPSGNYGVKTKVTNGDQKEEVFWLYYNVKKPAMILRTKLGKETEDVGLASHLTTTEKQAVIIDQSLKEAVSLINSVPQANGQLIPQSTPCPVASPAPALSPEGVDELASISEDEYTEEMLTPPFKQTDELPLLSGGCSSRSKEKPWEYCYKIKANGAKSLSSFQVSNKGPNEIISNPTGASHINRSYQFEFEDKARSDIQLYVVDSPDDFTSNATYNLYVFFPRKYLPAINKVGDELHVTLPTGEKVIYDAETKKIKSGVLSEKPMSQLPARPGCDTAEKACGRKAKADPVNYSGAGVVIKVSASGDLPVGDKENSAGQHVKNPNIATVQKGNKTCKLPVADYWTTDPARGDNVVFNPKYATDKAFDEVLKKRCGFSMF